MSTRFALISNLLGAHIFAWVIAKTPVVRPEIQASLTQLAQQSTDVSAGNAILRHIFAGWLTAMVVWMLAATDSGRLPIIVILTYFVGLAGLTHVVAGSVDVLFLVFGAGKTWISYVGGDMLPTPIGNVIGGCSMVSALNHSQVSAGTSTARREH